ncbi:MAG: hypothetical protein WCH43_03465 [Verrucomicrobiota bacterium]
MIDAKITVRKPLFCAVLPLTISAHEALRIAQKYIHKREAMQKQSIPGHFTSLTYYQFYGPFRRTHWGSGAHWALTYEFDRKADSKKMTIVVYSNSKTGEIKER